MSRLMRFQDELADRLIAESHFDNIEVITEDKGDIENTVSIALSNIGTAAIVMTPQVTVETPNLRHCENTKVVVVVHVVENPTMNRSASGTGKTALATAELVMKTLNHFRPDTSDGPVLPSKPTIKLASTNREALAYDVFFEGSINFSGPDDERVATPVVTKVGTTVTITCATEGAVIYYTVNEKNRPAFAAMEDPEQNAHRGTEYTGSFTAASGQKILARSWKASYQPSRTASLTV